MISILSWLITGLLVGLIARAIVPGKQSMGIFNTIMLGIFGAVLGGLASSAIWPITNENPDINQMWGGWLMAILGGVIVLWGYVAYTGRRNVAPVR